MKRRDFLRRVSYSGAGAMVLGGVPVYAMQPNGLFQLAAANSDNDNVLVFIQLHGGNDALNTLVPVSQYAQYLTLRPNIALKDTGDRSFLVLDENADDSIKIGLHPEMEAIKEMYDREQVAIIQNVGYPDMNMSHFRGRDIVFMGGDAESDYESGWMGRFLDETYPGYPDAYPNADMPDPLGIELSGTQSLAFHTETGIPNGLSFNSPDEFYNLINSVGLYDDQNPIIDPQIVNPNSFAGDELRYIMEFEQKNNQYAPRLKEVYDAGANSPDVDYPDSYPRSTTDSHNYNPLSSQFKLIARLLSGGIKTRIFLVRIGGFDTHGDQVEKDDTSKGVHAALMYHISEAVKAFYDDLKGLGHDKRVLSMTFTEFGRRAYSNDSLGTDHGTATPVLLFGGGVNKGVYGENPDLSNLRGGNLVYSTDYRQIYTSIIQDWFGADDDTMRAVGFDEWVDNRLDLVGNRNINDPLTRNNIDKLNVYPTMADMQVAIEFYLASPANYSVDVFNTEGKRVFSGNGSGVYGVNKSGVDVSGFSPGKYIVQLRTGLRSITNSFIKK